MSKIVRDFAEQPIEENKLTDKQRAFVLEYVKDWNGTQAAIRAGYSEDSASEIAYENLRKPQIRAMLDRYFESMGITADRILAEQAALAFTDMSDFVEVADGGGVTFKSFDDIGVKTRAIRKVKEKRTIVAQAEGDGNEVIVNSQLEFELYDKHRALDTLAKHVSGREKITAPPEPLKPDTKKESGQQMVDLMMHVIQQSQTGQLDPVIAKTVATLGAALLKANEQGVLEERIKALEALVNTQQAENDEWETDDL